MLLSVKNLRVQYTSGQRELAAVDGLDFDIEQGEIVGVMGESGSGKSTLALALLGLLPAGASWSADRMLFSDQDLANADAASWRKLRGKHLSMVFQDAGTALDPVFTVGQQIDAVFRRCTDTGRAKAHAASLEAFRSVGFADPNAIHRQFPHQLSGGMKQRVIIAMAMACKPELLIADEPSSALDVTTQAQVLNLLKAQVRQNHTALLLISHDVGVIAQYCDRALVIKDGVLVESAPIHELFAQPREDYTRQLLDAAPRLAI